jgi:type IV secretion system protein TrbL
VEITITDITQQILDQFQAAQGPWFAAVWPHAKSLFSWLALIEFTWASALMLLEKSDLQSWAAAMVRKVMIIGAFYALLLFGPTWILQIVRSFRMLGGNAVGSSDISPGDVFMRGLNIAGALMGSAAAKAFLSNPLSGVVCIIAGLLSFLGFLFVAIEYMVVMVESYIVLSAGMIFLGFGGSRWTVSTRSGTSDWV